MKELQTGSIGEGGCACGDFKCKDYSIHTHCHRSTCPLLGYEHTPCVRYSNETGKEHAEEIRKYIAEMYYGWDKEEGIEPNVNIHIDKSI